MTETASFSHTSLPPILRVSESGRAPVRALTASVRPTTAALQITRVIPVEVALVEDLARLASLPENWDSYGGAPPSETVIKAAATFVLRAIAAARSIGSEIPLPKVVAAGDGSVGLVWKDPSRASTLEVVIDDEGCHFILSRNGETSEGTLAAAEDVLTLLPLV